MAAMAALFFSSALSSTSAVAMATAAPVPWPVAGTVPLAELLRNLPALKEVRVMKQQEQQQSEAELRCIVVGSLCENARVYKQPALGLLTALRDERDPGCTIKLLVSNFTLSSSTDADARAWFPRGAVVRITEPRVLLAGAVGMAMMVDNPASVEIVGYGDLANEDANSLWKEANAAYSRGEYRRAAFLYVECVERGFPGALQAFSRSSEAWLRLGFHEKAFLDASRALAVNPSHFQSLFVKGQALLAMQEYAMALECLQNAGKVLAASPDEQGMARKVAEACERCSALQEQSVTGAYDLSQFLLGGRNPSLAPVLSDFVGSVRLQLVQGKGRGLFATKDLKAGDLVLVSNSIARSTKGGLEFHAKIGRVCAANRRVLAQLTAFFDEREMFGMDLFLPNSGWFQAHDDHSTPTSSYRYVFKELGSRNGLCPLATMINHSCLPNVSRHPVGGALFVRAGRDISAGEELITSYVNPFQPLAQRRKQMAERNFKFVCRCDRCKLEERIEAEKPGVATRYISALQNRGDPSAALMEMVKISEELDSMVEVGKTRDWIVSSYPYVYWTAGYLSRGSKAEKEARLESAAAAFHETAPGDLLTLRRMVELCSPGGSDFSGGPVHCSRAMREILEREAVSCFGHHNQEVLDAVIRTPGATAAGDLSF
ncbi:uncharacterized protein LOC112344283 [Selaginella moellendorffii]|uniref:uncharacterized protein LOC112344283 n=1 Tax=Selaginella moellendorffii TaxID=88036 RepID=UPI000D1C42DA|nr:uncharacterized protein LOC112344283 [Selaginella moellendorffii]|eukprot:XP_024524456.1 uncharacterized protein LOC112344283 [Selaginella moellendorffii]